jgi:uncharacterized membrane protein YbhN (UPF0104 family)
MSRSRWLITILSFAAMLAASAWVVAATWPADGMPWLPWQAHAGALASVVAEIVARTEKIRLSARAVGIPLGFGTALRTCLAGDFAAAITPARTGAEPARFLVLGEAGVGAAGRVLVLFLELFLEMCSLLVLGVLLVALFAGRGASPAGLAGLVGGYSAVVLGLGAVALLIARQEAADVPVIARRLGVSQLRWARVHGVAREVRHWLLALRGADVPKMLAAFGGSLLHVVLKVTALPVLVYVGDRSFPLSMDTLAPLVLWPLALFYGGVVVPAPGGGGFVEGAFAVTLKDAIPAGIFAASLLWWRFYTFYLYVVAGAVAAGDAVLRALRREPG